MVKLTDTQLVVLAKAAQRGDGAASVPVGMNKANAGRLATSLVGRKMLREMRAKTDMPVWREKAEGQGVCLIITRAGRDAIGVEEEAGDAAEAQDAGASAAAGAAARATRASRRVGKSAKAGNASKAPAKALKAPFTDGGQSGPSTPRAGSKQSRVIDLLSRDVGATIDDLTKATGWLPHTARAALTGLRKRGFVIERFAGEGRPGFYKIPFAGVPTLIIETGARAAR